MTKTKKVKRSKVNMTISLTPRTIDRIAHAAGVLGQKKSNFIETVLTAYLERFDLNGEGNFSGVPLDHSGHVQA